MIVAHRSLSGIREFPVIIQLCIFNDKLFVIVKLMHAWYFEHYRAFELNSLSSKEVRLLSLHDLADTYAVADYTVAGVVLVFLYFS